MLKVNTECELDAIDQSGCTPLHHACINAPDGHRSVKVVIFSLTKLMGWSQTMLRRKFGELFLSKVPEFLTCVFQFNRQQLSVN